MGNKSLFNLIKQSGLYALGNMAIKLSGLMLAPLYLNTRILSLEAYGQFAVLYVFAQLCIIIVGLGFGNGLLRYVGREEKGKEEASLPFTAVVSTIFLAIIYSVIIWMFADRLAGYFLDDASQQRVIQYFGIYVACKVVASVPMMLLRIQERVGLYVVVIVLEMLVLIGGVYQFLANQHMGLEGIYLAYAMASGGQMLVLLMVLGFNMKWHFEWKLLKPVFAYGGPLIFVGLAGLVLNAGDRFILKELSTDAIVGKYEWAARLSGVLNLFVVQSFQLAFTVLGLKTLGSGDLSLHRRAFRHFSIWAAWAVLGISLLAFDLTAALGKVGVDDYYLSSAVLVFPLAMGAMIYGVYMVINNVFFATAKTHVITWMVVSTAMLNLVLNILLVPRFEAFGAAAATVISYALLVWLANRKARQEVDIDYRWGTFFAVVGVISLLFTVGMFTQSWAAGPRIAARVFLVLTYFPCLFVLKIYTREEIALGWNFVKQKLIRTQG